MGKKENINDKKNQVPNCKNCEWGGCRDYGKDKTACNKYIREFD